MLYKGLKAPLVATKGGGLATESGSEQLKKIVMLSVAWCPSENPFNTDVGIEYPVFEINDVSLQSRTSLRIQNVFENLEGQDRARLIDMTFESVKEELFVDVDYYDMQTDRPDSVRLPVGQGGGT